MDAASPIITAVVIWSFIVKGIALWKAGKYDQKYWFLGLFIALFLFAPLANLAGIVDLIYLTKFAKKPLTLDEIRSWVQKPQKKRT